MVKHLQFSYRVPDEPLSAEDKTLLEFAIEAVIPTAHDTPPEKWFFIDDIIRQCRPRFPDEKKYNYFYENDFKNALRRLERRGTTTSNLYIRGWFKKRRYAYALPF